MAGHERSAQCFCEFHVHGRHGYVPVSQLRSMTREHQSRYEIELELHRQFLDWPIIVFRKLFHGGSCSEWLEKRRRVPGAAKERRSSIISRSIPRGNAMPAGLRPQLVDTGRPGRSMSRGGLPNQTAVVRILSRASVEEGEAVVSVWSSECDKERLAREINLSGGRRKQAQARSDARIRHQKLR